MQKFLNYIIFCVILSLATNCLAKRSPALKIIDGDSLVLNSTEIRLEGIDAPEYKQVCYDKNKQAYRCGIKAYEFLQDFVKGKKVTCQKISIDRYKRQVSFCYANGVDINQTMVQNGWAVAYDHYDDKYVKDESLARKNKAGIWQGKFMHPEIWRALHRRK